MLTVPSLGSMPTDELSALLLNQEARHSYMVVADRTPPLLGFWSHPQLLLMLHSAVAVVVVVALPQVAKAEVSH